VVLPSDRKQLGGHFARAVVIVASPSVESRAKRGIVAQPCRGDSRRVHAVRPARRERVARWRAGHRGAPAPRTTTASRRRAAANVIVLMPLKPASEPCEMSMFSRAFSGGLSKDTGSPLSAASGVCSALLRRDAIRQREHV